MGYGGCPMAKDDLTGNMPTENIISLLKEKGESLNINEDALLKSLRMSSEIFSKYH